MCEYELRDKYEEVAPKTKSEMDACRNFKNYETWCSNHVKGLGSICTRPKGHSGKCAIGMSSDLVIRIKKIKKDSE